MPLIDRLEAVADRLEAAAGPIEAATAHRPGQERLLFRGYLPVLLDDGRVKVHAWSKFWPVDWHSDTDDCSEMTVDQFRATQAAPPIALAST